MVISETRHNTQLEINFQGYSAFQSLPSPTCGVIVLVRDNLRPRLSNIYSNSTFTVQISSETHRTYIIGSYLHQGDASSLESLKQEVNQICNNFINPKLTVAGDFNEHLCTVERFLCKKRHQNTQYESNSNPNLPQREPSHYSHLQAGCNLQFRCDHPTPYPATWVVGPPLFDGRYLTRQSNHLAEIHWFKHYPE